MKVIRFAGPSGSGKTARIERLIRESVAEGKRVGAIKHTHHPLNTDDRGDTSRFLRAGADRVVLAGDRAAVIFEGGATTMVDYSDPRDLLSLFDHDVVFVEGFKDVEEWLGV